MVDYEFAAWRKVKDEAELAKFPTYETMTVEHQIRLNAACNLYN